MKQTTSKVMHNGLFLYILTLVLLFSQNTIAQRDFFDQYTFTKADSLRGGLGPERLCFDLHHYELRINIDVENKSIQGTNRLTLSNTCDSQRVIQLDLMSNLTINKISQNEKELHYTRLENAVFVELLENNDKNIVLTVEYEGEPIVAKIPPWDGGFIWTTDDWGNPWISVACQGLGASAWWPCMDHQSIEPDSMDIYVTTNVALPIICNGTKIEQNISQNTSNAHWKISDPINSYNVNVSIGNYQYFNDHYRSANGKDLSLEYYVLAPNLEKAKEHFSDVEKTLEAFEYYFGPYPYYKDGYALIETPFLGMEHQSGIAYGNQYRDGYFGRKALLNMNWDYIIVHESGHEWFGNYLTSNDIGDLWLHEAFTTYAEALFVEYHYDYNTAIKYLSTKRDHQTNKQPLIGPRGVQFQNWVSSDHYFKGSWVLHTLRHVIDDDELWFDLLKCYVAKFGGGTIQTEDFTQFASDFSSMDLDPFFEQYLYYPNPPTFVSYLNEENNELHYKWDADVKNFDMPFDIVVGETKHRLFPSTSEWKILKINPSDKIYLRSDLFLVDLDKISK